MRIALYALGLAVFVSTLNAQLRPSQHDCEVFGDARQRPIRAGVALPSSPRDAKNRPICKGEREPAPPGAGRIRSAGQLSGLILSIQGGVDRPIIDATQLTGNFEWQLLFSRGLPDASSQFPSMAVALEEQLGLKLQLRTMPFEALVIDSLELPTPN